MSLFGSATQLYFNGGSATKAYLNGTQVWSATVAVTGSPYQLLGTIASTLRTNITSLRNPGFYEYRLDGPSLPSVTGSSPVFINDGGNDMFDNGNYTVPWLRNSATYINSTTVASPPAINYNSSSVSLLDTDFYYVSLGYQTPGLPTGSFLPLTVLGSRSGTGPSTGWQKAGNIGADGAGSLQSGNVYTGQTVNGFTTYAFFRQTYGQSTDPTICDLYILLGHPNWSTTFGTVVSSSVAGTQLQGAALYTTGSGVKNVLAIATLLSRPSPSPISGSAIQTVVDTYTSLIKQALNY